MFWTTFLTDFFKLHLTKWVIKNTTPGHPGLTGFKPEVVFNFHKDYTHDI
jgi:hypothetical protein